MFHSARLKLTAWYLLIIMFVSLTFSVIIYKNLTNEVERLERIQRLRFERNIEERWGAPFHLSLPIPNVELIEESKQRLLFTLLTLNAAILVLSGLLGYWLAGRTLKPIKEMLDEQNRFITDASHELRTPLTSLKSAFEVYLRAKTNTFSEAKNIIKESLVDVNKLQSLTDSLLQLTQYQSSTTDNNFNKTSLSAVVKEAIRKVEPIAKKKQITLKYGATNYYVLGNRYGLVDLLVILLDNAIKYSEEKTTVLINMQKIDRSILLAVKDQGMGIEKKDLEHVFDRFYRADTARSKNRASGYGLGLSIAKKIAEVHLGSIEVESVVKKGTIFKVRLPIAKG